MYGDVIRDNQLAMSERDRSPVQDSLESCSPMGLLSHVAKKQKTYILLGFLRDKWSDLVADRYWTFVAKNLNHEEKGT